jgi:hypothetical protein
MPNVVVRCTVDNCAYWAEENYCQADTILITSDLVGERYPEGVDAPETDMIVAEMGETPARTCKDTACKTFRAR